MNHQTTDTLATRVQQLREANNLSKEKLAEKSYLKLSVIDDIEEGRDTFLSITTRQKLSKALRIPASKLKEVEKQPAKTEIRTEVIDHIKYNILIGNLNSNKCPKCGSMLIGKIVTFYDLEDNPVKHPKARCKKCPFQIK